MAFPSIATTSSGNDATGSSTFTLTLPTGISSGDKLILWVAVDGNTTVSWPAGYTELFDRNFSDGGFSGSGTGSLAYRNCDGTEGSSITVTKGNTQEDAWGCYRITGASSTAPEFQFAEGNSASPDCPSLTPSWGAKDTLWIVTACQDNADLTGTAPTNYANNVLHQFNTDAEIVMGSRQLNATSEDPGTFAAAADEWFALTIAVEPGTGDQTITGALYSDADTFYAATVSTTYDITGALYTDPDTFYGATVSATYDIAGALYSDPDTFFGATITPGPVNIDGGLFADPDSFGVATVSTTYNIDGALYSDGDTFYAATVASTYDIAASLFVDPDVFQAATVSTAYDISGALFADPDTFYSATIGAPAQEITGALYTDPDTFFAATITTSATISGSLYVDPDTFYNATIAVEGAASPSGLIPWMRRRRR